MKHVTGLLFGTALTLPLATMGIASAQELTTVNMINPMPRSANFFPLVVGEALGYFEEEGVEVNLLPSDTSIPYIAFLQNGQADIAMLDPFETVNAVTAGVDIATIYEVMQRASEGIAVRADSDIQSVADLEGETVGLASDRDSGVLSMALETVDLTLDDVQLVVVGEAGPTLANAFNNEMIAALTGSVAEWPAIRALGVEIRMITPEELERSPANTFAISAARKEELTEPLQGFLRAWSKGQYVATFAPDVVAAMLQEAVPAEWEDPAFGQEFLDASIMMNLSTTEQIGDLQPELWEALQPRLIKVGAIEEEVPVDQFLDDSFIGHANDFDRDEVEAETEEWRAANM